MLKRKFFFKLGFDIIAIIIGISASFWISEMSIEREEEKAARKIEDARKKALEMFSNKVQKEDFVICEIGGTVGDIESLPFLESIRQFSLDLGKSKSMFVHLTLLPYMI